MLESEIKLNVFDKNTIKFYSKCYSSIHIFHIAINVSWSFQFETTTNVYAKIENERIHTYTLSYSTFCGRILEVGL